MPGARFLRYGFEYEDTSPTVGHRRIREGPARLILVSLIVPMIMDADHPVLSGLQQCHLKRRRGAFAPLPFVAIAVRAKTTKRTRPPVKG
jgi:hypothetical protein